NRGLNRVSARYGGGIDRLVALPAARLVLLLVVTMGACLAAAALLFWKVPSELSPAEDRGRFFVAVDAAEGAGFDYTVAQMQQVARVVVPYVGGDGPIERANSRVPRGWGGSEEMHTGNVIVFLKDWRVREAGTAEVVEQLRGEFASLPGVQVRANVPGG